MATLPTTNPTMVDVAKATNADGTIASTVELLHQTNDILEHATWLQCNDGASHRTTVRTGLPAPTWRKLYGGIQPDKSTRAQIVDSTGMLDAMSEIDQALVELNGNTEAFRRSEDAAFVEALGQEFSETLIYGNDGTAPEEFTGLAPRYSSLSAENGVNIIDAGGNDDDLTSIWLVVWGPNTAHCIYPKGFTAGLNAEDLGVETIDDIDGNNGRMRAYRTYFTWKCGFVLRDWRYAVRIANIDVSALSKDPNASGATGADLLDLMSQAAELIPNLRAGRPVFYVSRAIRSVLRRQQRFAVAQSTLSMDQVGGKHFVMFDDIPVARVDSILHTEDRIT